MADQLQILDQFGIPEPRDVEAGTLEQRLERLEHHLLDLMTETGQSPQEQLDELEAALRFDPDNRNFRLEVAHRGDR